METTQTPRFVRAVLPWLVAAVMLLIYLFTLNTVVTAQSVFPLARAAGMDWHAVYIAPLTFLVTLPIRWLSGGAQLYVLNFMAALFGALSLGLLARSVALLPHDRTQLQRDKGLDENGFLNIRLAWLPVLFAVVAAGFQRSFWENAIIGTGEMIDLLLFAYSVRCLLEYRVEEKNSWLFRLAVVYGAGMANNFAMIAFLPALLIALVWIKGWRFFRFDFLVKMFLFGLAGLSLYLVLPLVNASETGFWAALKTNLYYQKQFIFGLRRAALLPAIYCLVPLLIMGIKWSGGFGDQSPMGSVFANLAAILLHAGLLVFCLYVVFDPPVSPRQLALQFRDTGARFVFLPAYYLGAIIVGYYSGFLLLVFSKQESRSRRRSGMPPLLNYAVTGLVCLGAAFVTGRLLYENFPYIRQLNSRSLHNLATELVKSLPDKPAAILSDDPVQLYAVQSLARGKSDHVYLDAIALTEPAYHRFLQKRYGKKVPKVDPFPGEVIISSPQNIQAVHDLRGTRELFYLHPSFGYFFEAYYLEPRQLAYAMKLVPDDAISGPPPAPVLVAGQQAYWDSLRGGVLKDLKAELAVLPEDRRLRNEMTAPFVAGYYSRSLDFWGVELQRAGRFEDAAPIFSEALALNADNASAAINRAANAHWRKEKQRLPKLEEPEEAKLALYRGNLPALFTACGPIDEPSFLAEFANTFTQNTLYRQAERMLVRGLEYIPDDIALQLALANVYVLAQRPDAAIARLTTMRAQPGWAKAEVPTLVEAARIEATALMARTNFAAAERLLKSLRQRHPDQEATHYALSQLYSAHSEQLRDAGQEAESAAQRTNALAVIEEQLRLQPTNAVAWFTLGNLAFRTGDFDRSVEAFTKVLEITRQKNKAALLNRAVTYLRDGLARTNETRAAKFKLARADYDDYTRRFTPDFRVYFGLAEIAYNEKDWRAAREYYESYLQYSGPATTEEKRLVRARLEEIKKK